MAVDSNPLPSINLGPVSQQSAGTGVPQSLLANLAQNPALAAGAAGAAATAADLVELDPYYGTFIQDQPVLAIDTVRHVGEPVAAVAAIDDAQAFRALERIRIEYEPLPALMTARALRRLEQGTRLAVFVTDPLAPLDIRFLCEREGHQFLEQASCGEGMRLLLRKS